jgi:hypothetical protein
MYRKNIGLGDPTNADLNANDNSGRTAFDIASEYDDDGVLIAQREIYKNNFIKRGGKAANFIP